MKTNDLITKQQLEIEDYKQKLKENKKVIKALRLSFYAIGQPLNDNRLKFNKDQLRWCFGVYELIEQIRSVKNDN